ncbi:MAG: alcohol dehydrogenase catalytic domain-containing protein [Planctomycetota bacterium]
MHAAVFLGPRALRIETVPDPVCGRGDVKLKVLACGICGTDVHLYERRQFVGPISIGGHEVCGEAIEVGPEVGGISVGDRCVLAPAVGCGRCRYCVAGRQNLCPDLRVFGADFPGGFAQEMLIPGAAVRRGCLFTVPASLDARTATLVEPLACVLHAQGFLDILPDDVVVVAGAGPTGCMHARLAQMLGASVILADVSAKRLVLARRFGFDLYVDPAEVDLAEVVMSRTGGRGADVAVLACSSARAQEDAVRYIASGGRVSLFGYLPEESPVAALDTNALHRKEAAVFGAMGSTPCDFPRSIALVADPSFEASGLVTDSFPLGDIARAFEYACRAEGLKVVVLPN